MYARVLPIGTSIPSSRLAQETMVLVLLCKRKLTVILLTMVLQIVTTQCL